MIDSPLDIPEIEPQDAAAYLAETKREALQVLFPAPREMKERLSLITTLRGKSPNLYSLYCAKVEWEVLCAIEERRKIDWNRLDPIEFIRAHASSIQARHANRAVEIARAAPTDHRHSLLDMLRGK